MSDLEKKDIKSVEFIPPRDKASMEFHIKGEDGKTIIDPQISVNQYSKQDINLRDENVQEILTSVPHWMIRWGNILFLFLVLLIIFISWLIKYPDTVSDNVLIEKSTDNKNYIGVVSSKKIAFQKVEEGQKVQISLFAYPESENGILLGVVDTVYWNKSSKEYISKIKLSNELVTTYEVKVNPETNLDGLAKIIIKDKRLIENFFKLK